MRLALRLCVLFVLVNLLPGTTANAQITEAEYAARRAVLRSSMDTGAVIAFGATTHALSKYRFSQLPSFDYLTGYHEPDAVLILESEAAGGHTTLFTPARSVRSQFYDGFTEDNEAISRRMGMTVTNLAAFPAHVDSLVRAGVQLFEIPDVQSNDVARRDSVRRGGMFMEDLRSRFPELEVTNLYPQVWAQRAKKSDTEIELLKRSIAITDSAHYAALRTIRPGAYENEVQAAIEWTYRRLGAEGPGFGSIVASGPHATLLHYRAGERKMESGELVVMDIGARFKGYVADVTRTLPVSGRFTPEQRALYDLVLGAQKAAEERSVLGGLSADSREAAVQVRLDGLAELGLIQHPDSTYDPPWPADCNRTPSACSQGNLFMIHGISHGIGLEVHDAAGIGLDGRFAVGDVFTVEPGLYVSAKAMDLLPDTPKNRVFVAAVRETVERYDGIGIRIEDDFLMTEDGAVRLSVGSLRDPDRIEAAMAAARGMGSR